MNFFSNPHWLATSQHPETAPIKKWHGQDGRLGRGMEVLGRDVCPELEAVPGFEAMDGEMDDCRNEDVRLNSLGEAIFCLVMITVNRFFLLYGFYGICVCFFGCFFTEGK